MLGKLLRGIGIGDRRRHRRVAGRGVRVLVDGEDIELLDWSLGGFKAAALPVPYERGARLEGVIHVARVRGPFTGVLVARHADGGLAVQYDEIDADVFRALSEHGSKS